MKCRASTEPTCASTIHLLHLTTNCHPRLWVTQTTDKILWKKQSGIPKGRSQTPDKRHRAVGHWAPWLHLTLPPLPKHASRRPARIIRQEPHLQCDEPLETNQKRNTAAFSTAGTTQFYIISTSEALTTVFMKFQLLFGVTQFR
jgi:hypothetical protein